MVNKYYRIIEFYAVFIVIICLGIKKIWLS